MHIFFRMYDICLVAIEWITRQVYWRLSPLRSLYKRTRKKNNLYRTLNKETLTNHLRSIGVKEGELVMAHTSITNLGIQPAFEQAVHTAPFSVADELLTTFLDLLGKTGTLVMPTHPLYLLDKKDKKTDTQFFNPQKTSCSVGLTNEIFWRMPDSKRSLFPYNTLAANGPLSDEIMHNNLSGQKPTPHGLVSGYYRACQKNALVVSVGCRLGLCLTLIHTAEDIHQTNWPIKDFYKEEKYFVVTESSRTPVTIRKIKKKYLARSLCLRKVRRDLLQENILHESTVDGVEIDWLRAGDLLQFLLSKGATAHYPYFLPKLAGGFEI